MIYEWKTKYFKTDANVAGKVFDELDKTVGLTAENVVNASRDENAPLHNEFEWDDAIAGENWRRRQASTMIANLVIRVDESSNAEPTRAYVMVTTEDRKYENISVVLKDEDKRKKLLQNAMKELLWFERKYAELEALAGVFKEIDKLGEIA